MLNFNFPTIEDKQWIDEIMNIANIKACEYSVGNIIFWAKNYNTKIAKYKGFFVAKCCNEPVSYCFPIGNGDYKEVFEAIKEDAKSSSLKFHNLTTPMCEILKEHFLDSVTFKESRDDFDYIYNTSDLTNLAGKKYHSKRNHISRFKRQYEFTYHDVDSSNIDEIIKFNQDLKLTKDDEDAKDEIDMSIKMLENFDKMGFIGGLIKVDGKIVAYTMGEKLTDDTFCVHVEKALKEYNGAYTVINNEFVSRKLQSYKYVNREEDVGSLGLRKAKLSYYPEILLEKYVAFVGE